jgi:hypothetical protein
MAKNLDFTDLVKKGTFWRECSLKRRGMDAFGNFYSPFFEEVYAELVVRLLTSLFGADPDMDPAVILDSKHCPELLVAVFKRIRIRIRIYRIRMFLGLPDPHLDSYKKH